MSRIEDRIVELGLSLPPVVPPVAAYVPAVIDGERVWTAGQLPMMDGALAMTGSVGRGPGLLDPEQAADAARICALNALAAIKSVAADLDRVERIVKVVVFVASEPTFTGQPAVANGASTLLVDVFGERGVHARSAVGVAALPMGAPVEVELVASLRR